jgi:hypothetical protein
MELGGYQGYLNEFFWQFFNTLWIIIGWILSMWLKGECSWMNFMHHGIGNDFNNDCYDNHCWWTILRYHPWHFLFVGLTTFVLQNVSTSFISSKKLCVLNSFSVFMYLNTNKCNNKTKKANCEDLEFLLTRLGFRMLNYWTASMSGKSSWTIKWFCSLSFLIVCLNFTSNLWLRLPRKS